MRSGLDLRMMIRITGLATGKILPYPPDVKMPSDMMLISTNLPPLLAAASLSWKPSTKTSKAPGFPRFAEST